MFAEGWDLLSGMPTLNNLYFTTSFGRLAGLLFLEDPKVKILRQLSLNRPSSKPKLDCGLAVIYATIDVTSIA